MYFSRRQRNYTTTLFLSVPPSLHILYTFYRNQVEHDVERHVLGLTVRLSDGSVGTIYRRSDRRFDSGVFAYDCRLCGVPNLVGERCLHMHIAGKKHQAKLAQPFIDAIAFRSPMQRNRPQSKCPTNY